MQLRIFGGAVADKSVDTRRAADTKPNETHAFTFDTRRYWQWSSGHERRARAIPKATGMEHWMTFYVHSHYTHIQSAYRERTQRAIYDIIAIDVQCSVGILATGPSMRANASKWDGDDGTTTKQGQMSRCVNVCDGSHWLLHCDLWHRMHCIQTTLWLASTEATLNDWFRFEVADRNCRKYAGWVWIVSSSNWRVQHFGMQHRSVRGQRRSGNERRERQEVHWPLDIFDDVQRKSSSWNDFKLKMMWISKIRDKNQSDKYIN